MVLRCPCCGASLSADALAANEDARHVLEGAFTLADLGPRILSYLGLFRPPSRSLGWGRARRLVGDLVAMISAGEVMRNGVRHRVEPGAWAAALDAVLANRDRGTLRLPLRDHAYLAQIAVAEAARLGEAEERRREEEIRRRPPPPGPPSEGPARITTERTRALIAEARRAAGLAPRSGESC